eukprot:scaffold27657_cov42-Prasinocladus_malaysianus.AAC.1
MAWISAGLVSSSGVQPFVDNFNSVSPIEESCLSKGYYWLYGFTSLGRFHQCWAKYCAQP